MSDKNKTNPCRGGDIWDDYFNLNSSTMNNNIQIPNHSSELNGCNEKLEDVKYLLKQCEINQSFPQVEFDNIYAMIVRVLEKTADLSLSAFDIRNNLEDQITLKYKSTPELATKMFCDSYASYHKPYNTIKNRCYSLFDAMEEQFILINNRPPKYKGE